MEIRVEKRSLIMALEIGGTFAGKSKINPILSCVKIKVGKDFINVVSSDSENAISKKISDIETGVEDTIAFCVDYKDLYSYVKLVPGDFVELILKGERLTIHHEKGEINIPVQPVDAFPIVKSEEETKEYVVPSALVNNWILDGQSFVSDDDLRPILGQIYFYRKDNEFGCCSSDGNVLYTNNVPDSGDDFEFTLNKGAFRAVCGALQDTDEVKILIGNKNVSFVSSDVSVLSRRAEGRYVNFKAVIPKNNDIVVKLSKQELIGAINRCKLGADQFSNLCKISIDGMNMSISGNDADFSKKSVENLLVEANGNITIGMKATYLLSVLNVISSENVNMSFSTNSRPCVIEDDIEGSNKKVILMPMMM